MAAASYFAQLTTDDRQVLASEFRKVTVEQEDQAGIRVVFKERTVKTRTRRRMGFSTFTAHFTTVAPFSPWLSLAQRKFAFAFAFSLFAPLGLLNDYPHYKRLWPQFEPIHDSVLLGAAEVACFAKRFMGGLKTIINSLEAGDDEKAADALGPIAKVHKTHNIREEHITHMAEAFEQMLLKELGPSEFTAKDRAIWRKMFESLAQALTKKIQEGDF